VARCLALSLSARRGQQRRALRSHQALPGRPGRESDRTNSSRSRMPACARLIALFASWEQPFEGADPWLPAVGYEPLADLFKLIHASLA